jgi:hypothetical protein
MAEQEQQPITRGPPKEAIFKKLYSLEMQEQFYTRIGYPQYVFKYQPFTIPEGYTIEGIKETPSGLEVTFKSTIEQPKPYVEPQKGLAETLAGIQVKPVIDIPRLFGVPRTPQETLTPPSMRKETVRPFAGIASSLIAPTERLVYSVGRLARLETPRIPPYFSEEYGPEWGAGTIAGELLLSLGIGKVVGKVWEAVPKVIKSPVTKVAETATKPFRPITEPIMSKLEKWVLWPHERIAPGIVSIPTPERVGLKGMEAQLTGWELAEAPKTSAYLISKMPSEPLAKAWAMEHLFKTVTGGLSYALVREQLRATAPPTMPYLPEVEPVGFMVKGLALGVGVTLLPKALQPEVAKPKLETIPKLKPQVFEEPYEIQKLKLFPQVYPRQKQREKAMLMPKLSMEVATQTMLKQEVLQIPKQVQKQILTMPTPLLQKQILSFPAYPRVPSMRLPSFKGLGKGLFGKWFKRTHAIPTEKQIMRELGFGRRRGKKRGGKRRRR